VKKVALITSTRAEYGLFKPLIARLISDADIDLKVVVTGSHLLAKHGLTVSEIEKDRVSIDEKIDIYADEEQSTSNVMANALRLFSSYFHSKRPDAVIVLGDRYEILAVSIAAYNERIPICHIHGGETTEGAVDEAYRHAITKMSYLHFTSTEIYRKRVIQLGEAPDRVFNVGALGVENALNVDAMNIAELEAWINNLLSMGDTSKQEIRLTGKYAIGTFHPVTLENNTEEAQVKELLGAIELNKDITYIFTAAGADAGGRAVNEILEEYEKDHDNFYFVPSLGMRGYLSAVKEAAFVIGNSSSGIIEVPSFHVPTINIGDRQKGRVCGKSVISCIPDKREIDMAIKKALSQDFLGSIKEEKNLYGDGNTSGKIAGIIKDELNRGIDIKKSFYDIEF